MNLDPARAATPDRRAELPSRILCRLERVWLGVLSRLFGFDAWHAAAPYSCRPYKKQVVELVNALHPACVVEIGCGLGDILSRVTAPQRFGVDADVGVIRAARLLRGSGVRWIHGTVDEVERLLPQRLPIDCLIMVNWIHNLSPESLAEVLLPLLTRVRYLLLDAIDVDAPGNYRFRHDFGFLATRTERVSTIHPAGEPRSLIVFRVVA